MFPYSTEIETIMKKYYQTLSEKDKRRYAAIEALKLSHGGIIYIARLLGCSDETIYAGIKELKALPNDSGYDSRIRQTGGGRKSFSEEHPQVDHQLEEVLKNRTAGSPMNENVIWTDLNIVTIMKAMLEMYSAAPSWPVMKRLLRKNEYRRRKIQKSKTMKQVKHRNEQFENIARKVAEYQSSSNPIISFDTKKKEYLGNFYREGRLYTRETLRAYDHDFNNFADGVIIPHGIYDFKQNSGYINLGLSKDTAEFACDCIRNWWRDVGRARYPLATSILALCDGGGSNNSRHYLFKEQLQNLANEIGVEIHIAHYPPYTSKYNPIEHRLFPHVTRACQGVIFESVEIVKQLVKKTKTEKGLSVIVNVIDKLYQTGKKVAKNFKENMSILFDDHLPKWNYRAIPLFPKNG